MLEIVLEILAIQHAMTKSSAHTTADAVESSLAAIDDTTKCPKQSIADSDDHDNNHITIKMPNFSRLFVIKRILDKHIIDNGLNKNQTIEMIKELIKIFKHDTNLQTESIACDIVTRLFTNSVKEYMNKQM